jgi:hypothetical protein
MEEDMAKAPESAPKKTRSKADNPDRVIALITGDSGTGKSYFVGSMKNALIYDTDLGGGLAYMDERISANGSERVELYRYPDILADLRSRAASGSLPPNVVIDHVTVLQQEAVGRHNPTHEADFGRSGAKANGEWRQIREFIRTFDCNLWVVSHQKVEFEKDKAVGKIADGAKNIEGDMHIVLRLTKQREGKSFPAMADVLKWRRLPEDPRGPVPDKFPFTLEGFEKINGTAYTKERAKIELAKPESVATILKALEFLGKEKGGELTQTWFSGAGVEKFEQMTEGQVQGCIQFIKEAIEKGAK